MDTNMGLVLFFCFLFSVFHFFFPLFSSFILFLPIIFPIPPLCCNRNSRCCIGAKTKECSSAETHNEGYDNNNNAFLILPVTSSSEPFGVVNC